MQDERINVSAKFCNHKRHSMSHETAHEVDVLAEAIQLGDGNGALEPLCGC